jgi:hypothetical protein
MTDVRGIVPARVLSIQDALQLSSVRRREINEWPVQVGPVVHMANVDDDDDTEEEKEDGDDGACQQSPNKRPRS